MTSPMQSPTWLQPYSDNEMFDIMRHAHDVRPRLNDTLLHTLASDPDFDTRDTMPAPPPSSCAPTIPAAAPPPAPSSAPPVDADSFDDGWM